MLLLPELRELLGHSPEEVAGALEDLHPPDVAELAEELVPEERTRLLAALPAAYAAETLEHLDDADQRELLAGMDMGAATAIIARLAPDERADLLAQIDPERARQILDRIEPEPRQETEELLRYGPETAGGLMTTELVSLPGETRVDQAVTLLKLAAKTKESIYHAYVTDGQRRLLGVATLRRLLTAPPDRPVSEVMTRNFVSVDVGADREVVAETISKYDLIAVPVLDAGGRLLGVVTVDDVVDVMVDETTEDVHRLGAVKPLAEPYFDVGVPRLLRSRAPWLMLLFFAGLAVGGLLRVFEHTLAQTMALVAFLPLVIASGGNAASQSAMLIIRGLAVGDVEVRDAMRVARREAATGIGLGVLLAAAGLGLALLGWDTGLRVATVVSVTLVSIVVVGALVGGLLPLAFKRLGVDPAIASGPFVTSVIDVVGVGLYLAIAALLVP